MLIFFIVATLLALLAGATMPRVIAAAPALWAHVALAMGVMTLITAAMQHFVPVLARARGASGWIAHLPWLMLASGGLAVAVFAGALPWLWLAVAALLGLLGAGLMLAWMWERAQMALGAPHPGVWWYVAAVACLAAGLLAASMMSLLPAWHGALRAFHIHINLYGFVALTAIGTLQVLMPTAAGIGDPRAAARLRADLKWALAGSLAIAFGQALLPPLAWLGAMLWAWVLARMLRDWLHLLPGRLFALHGNEPVLFAATLGFGAALVGALSGMGNIGPLTLFLPGFLMPLVSGAAGQLAPVWLAPGETARHRPGQARLGRWGGVRALLFLSAALLPLFGYKCSGMPALTALFWFGIVFAFWLYREEPSQ